jgi:PAS domain S-box-containing protein
LIWDGFIQDITQQKQIESTLLEEKRNFQNLFETIDEFLFVYDMDGKLLHTNPAVERRLNYSADELKSMSLFELYPENLRSEVLQMLARMQSEPSVHSNLPLQIKNGETIVVEMNLFQGNWKNREAIFGVARDISSRQQAETALRESQQMLQLIMDTIPMSVFWKDKDSLYLGGNHAFIKDCGLTQEEELLGKSAYDFFDSNTAKHMIERDQQVINSNHSLLNDQYTFSYPDGRIGWRETNKVPLHDEKGAVTGVLVISRDVTEQNRAEEHLKRTLEDLERFNQLMRGRERRTLELKAEINALLQEMGKDIKYKTTTKPIL